MNLEAIAAELQPKEWGWKPWLKPPTEVSSKRAGEMAQPLRVPEAHLKESGFDSQHLSLLGSLTGAEESECVAGQSREWLPSVEFYLGCRKLDRGHGYRNMDSKKLKLDLVTHT